MIKSKQEIKTTYESVQRGESSFENTNKIVYSLELETDIFTKIKLSSVKIFKIVKYEDDINIWAYFFTIDLGDLVIEDCILQGYTYSDKNTIRFNIPYDIFTKKIKIYHEDQSLTEIDNPFYELCRDDFMNLLHKIKNQLTNVKYKVVEDSNGIFSGLIKA